MPIMGSIAWLRVGVVNGDGSCCRYPLTWITLGTGAGSADLSGSEGGGKGWGVSERVSCLLVSCLGCGVAVDAGSLGRGVLSASG